MRIGDVFLRVLAELEGFEADIVKKGEKEAAKAGETLGQRLSGGLKKALSAGARIAAGVVATGLAIATKGAIELQNIQADFQAQTGASADEAAAAAKTINRVAGENRQSLESVSAAAIKVRRDLGAVGPEADALLADFVRFARITKQDAGGAVSDFDDILDAWGLTAKDATGIMDKLLVSQQRFGGSVTENQKALGAFAPQLRALGATVDEGIGLLNLFAASGLDASKATFALNTAVQKLKPGQTLNDLIAQISAIEDPTQRAQKAIELFGARGGVSLANVLRPGVDSLEAFQVSAEDAAGATEKAADVIDSTFTGRIQKAISVASAQLRQFGADFGPAATGLAGLASLAGSIGGGKLVKGLLGPLAGLGGKVKTRIVAAIMSAIIPASVAGGLIGDATAEGVSTGLGRSKAMGVAQKALGAVGKVWGSILGKATVLGAVAVIGVELFLQLQELNARNAAQVKGIGENIGNQIATGTKESLEQSRAALQKGISDLDPFALFLGGDFRNTQTELKRQLDLVNAAIAERVTTGAETTKAAAFGVGQALDRAAPKFTNVGTKATEMAANVASAAAYIKATVHGLVTALAAEARALIDGYYDPLMLQDDLMAANAEAAAARRVLADKNASKEQKANARATLNSLGKTQSDYLLRLAEAGKTSSKAYRDGIKSLKKAIKDAKGPAKAALQEILNKILEVERAGKTVPVNVVIRSLQQAAGRGAQERAAGGPVRAGGLYVINEDTPRSEFFSPDVSGTVVTHAAGMAMLDRGGAAKAGDTYNLHMPVERAPDPFRTATQLRRLADFKQLAAD